MSPSDLPVAILAGGLAKRLRPITEKLPKLLVEVAGEPFFSHQLRLLKNAGLRQIVLCVGYIGEMVVGPKLLGTGGALIRALPRLGDAFYILYGDSYLPVDYLAVGRSFLASGQLGLMTVYENQERYDTSNVWFAEGRIKVYDKKNKVPQMHHIDYGLGLLRARALDGWPRDETVDLAAVYGRLVAQDELAGYEVKQRFYEIGSPAGLRELDGLLRTSPLDG
jgi:NDP-sugar pyrophosphorylase family protein